MAKLFGSTASMPIFNTYRIYNVMVTFILIGINCLLLCYVNAYMFYAFITKFVIFCERITDSLLIFIDVICIYHRYSWCMLNKLYQYVVVSMGSMLAKAHRGYMFPSS